MSQEVVNNPNSAMLKEVSQVHSRAGREEVEQAEELPEGTSAIETKSETSVIEEASSEETSEETAGEVSTSTESDEEPIRLNGQLFKNQKEAIEYAEQIAREKELAEAHTAGVREALEAQLRAQAQPAQPEPEDDFEQRFYANPKETLKEVQARARDEALAAIKAEQQREKLWSDFLSEYPDIRRKDAERVLQENWETIGKMTDLEKGKKLIAQKVRSEYDEIVTRLKPKTQLTSKPQAVSPSGGSPSGVTPTKKVESSLSFAEQMRKLRGLS